MKKVYLLLAAIGVISTSAMAQIEIREFSGGQAVGNDLAGTTWNEAVTEEGTVVLTFNVLNTSGSQKVLKVNRVRVVENAAWSDFLCWGPNPDPNFEGMCYPASAMNVANWTTPTGVTVNNNDDANLQVDVHIESAGNATYRYIIMDGTTKLDSIDVQFNSSLSIQDQTEEPLGMTAYPNPANNNLTIATTGTDGNCAVRITDVLGKVVYSEEMGTTKKVDVSEFKNGVYLVTVTEKGQLVQTRRIVVKH